MALNFEYCECGCHGHEASAGALHFWIFNNLKGRFFLHQGHGWLSPKLSEHTSFQDAEKAANEVVKGELTKLLAVVDLERQ